MELLLLFVLRIFLKRIVCHLSKHDINCYETSCLKHGNEASWPFDAGISGFLEGD